MAHMLSMRIREAALDHCRDGRKIEQRFHQVGVVGHRVNDIDDHATHVLAADGGQINIVRLRTSCIG